MCYNYALLTILFKIQIRGVKQMQQIQQLFPSEDGNLEQRKEILNYIEKIFTSLDELKDPEKSTLGPMQERSANFYKELIENYEVPVKSTGMDNVVNDLIDLMKGHPYHTRKFVTNVLPMASIPGIIGLLTTTLLNGNNLWDVYGPAAAESEVKVIGMMSKLVGYDFTQSWGYTTWGGQGAVFSGLRLAIAKQFPHAKEEGVPRNLYCFASENAHYSLLKSAEAVGIGSNNLIRVKATSDHSMDLKDLANKLEEVIHKGGIPVYIVATTGATDSFAIDDVKAIKDITSQVEAKYELKPIHIHADSALGGFYSFFKSYDFNTNPLKFEDNVVASLQSINERMQHISLADSLCFDFQKLGQTPYLTSLFLVKEGKHFGLLDLEDFDTPYVGNRGYGSYHTGYTLECSRMGSSIAIYAALNAFGVEGYQQILANYVRVNLAFRDKIQKQLPNVSVVNDSNIGPVTAFRLYPKGLDWSQEKTGTFTLEQVQAINNLNQSLFEILGHNRENVFFGDTTKVCTIPVINSEDMIPVAAAKLFAISPYTEVQHLDEMVASISSAIHTLEESNIEIVY